MRSPLVLTVVALVRYPARDVRAVRRGEDALMRDELPRKDVGASGGAPRSSVELDELARSEARFRTLVEHAPDAIVMLDVETGRFADVNGNACRLFGMSREELLRHGPGDLSPELQPDGRVSIESAGEKIGRALAGESLVFEWVHQNAAGEIVDCEVRLVLLPESQPRLVRGSILDIGERKRNEAAQARLAAELHQAQKMQAIGQLTGGVAHDFNNLLTAIRGNLELMDLDESYPLEVRQCAEQAIDATERAAALTQRLLAFARKQPLRPRVVQLNRLVQEAESLLHRTLGETIEIETVLGSGLWSCAADPTQLENVVLNLAINARDAMPRGGRLTIETANVQVDGDYASTHVDLVPGNYVLLAVSDSGTGMTPEVMEQAFEPFFTTKEIGKGSGLGLSMIYGFVKQSGGHVNIYSEPGEGTTVRVYLPRAASDREQPPAPPPATEVPGDGSLVLVVEDDPRVRRVVCGMLEKLAYRSLHAENAESALEVLKENLDVALVLTDIVLPGGINGPDLAGRAAALRPDLPLVFMSGYTETAIVRSGRFDADVPLIEKPFSRRDLALVLHEALRASRMTAGG